MSNVIAHTAEELQYMLDHTHVLSDEAVIERIRQVERVLWAGDRMPLFEIHNLQRYRQALTEEALKRMREDRQ
jgi:hypothetical protein